MIAPIVSAADGPKPTLVHFSNRAKERELVGSVVAQRHLGQRVAVLLRTHEKIREIRTHLPDEAIQLNEEGQIGWPETGRTLVRTILPRASSLTW